MKLGGDARKRLRACGVSEAQYDELVEAHGFLLRDEPLSPDEWLKAFSLRFQLILDAAAERRAKRYAMKVGVATAATPVAVIDQLIVLLLVRGLDQGIDDHLRTASCIRSDDDTPYARSIVATYLSGLAQELSEDGVDTVWDAVAPI